MNNRDRIEAFVLGVGSIWSDAFLRFTLHIIRHCRRNWRRMCRLAQGGTPSLLLLQAPLWEQIHRLEYQAAVTEQAAPPEPSWRVAVMFVLGFIIVIWWVILIFTAHADSRER